MTAVTLQFLGREHPSQPPFFSHSCEQSATVRTYRIMMGGDLEQRVRTMLKGWEKRLWYVMIHQSV